ncbi:hypothetical protein [Arthrobacter globiformis]|uniref:hypothetical protein n=1 Tax=Arthrobacter globiformis TaxID=1665 RepID=UPI0027D8490F|nr:hypothetical protein [Arthrobacter globiformis]
MRFEDLLFEDLLFEDMLFKDMAPYLRPGLLISQAHGSDIPVLTAVDRRLRR